MARLIRQHIGRSGGAVLAVVLFLLMPLARPGSGLPPASAAMQQEGAAAATPFDRLFIDMMVPHHMSATAMAQIALTRAQHAQIKSLARAIIAAQTKEIGQMKQWRAAWYGSAVTPPMDKMPMLPGLAMGMMDTMGDIARLKTATPFDKAFIDAMMPHHQMAIAAAKLELAHGSHSPITALALAVIEDQAREIGLMTAYRELWYGTGAMPSMSGLNNDATHAAG